jgi:sugar phosphate isomerase/epimerase
MLNVATKFAPVTDAFRTAAKAGFQCAELWTDAAVLADWKNVARRAAKFPLRYGLHFPNRKDLEPKSLKHCVALYEALECRAMVIHQPHFDLYGAELLRLKPDMVLAIENHRLKPEALAEWFAKTEFLTLDVEHVWKFTLHDPPLEELWKVLDPHLKKHGHKLRHVHLPGYVPNYDEHRPMYCNRDFVFGMFDRLARLDYDGLIVSEVEIEYQNLNDLRMDVILTDTWHRQQTQRSRSETGNVLNR